MSLGFNTKVQLADGLYHVQTEDRGPARPLIDTLVLFQGQVLHRCSRSYQDMLAGGAPAEDWLRSRVEAQHREVLAALRGGVLSLEKIAPSELSSIAVKLSNAGSWLAAGKASLEVQVSGKRDRLPCAGAEVEATIEGALPGTEVASAQTDTDGRAVLSFAMPAITEPENAFLVIRARHEQMSDEIRYRLKSKPQPSGPAAK
jgi:hypothetical protein